MRGGGKAKGQGATPGERRADQGELGNSARKLTIRTKFLSPRYELLVMRRSFAAGPCMHKRRQSFTHEVARGVTHTHGTDAAYATTASRANVAKVERDES